MEINKTDIPAGSKLTVIMRNDSPMIFCGDVPTYRRVTIELMPEQQEKLMLKWVGFSTTNMHESVSKCFLEE